MWSTDVKWPSGFGLILQSLSNIHCYAVTFEMQHAYFLATTIGQKAFRAGSCNMNAAFEGLRAHLLVRTRQSCASAGPTAVVLTEARWDDWHCRNHLVGTNCYQGQGMKHQIQGGAFSLASLSCLLGQSISPSEEVLAGCTSTNKCRMYTSYLDNNNVSARRRFQEEGS